MPRALRFLGLFVSFAFAAGVAFADPPPGEICDNGVDDDGDFEVDCADVDCVSAPACDFGSGCCILTACQDSSTDGGGSGGRPPAPTEVRCLDDLTQQECSAVFSGAVDPGGGGATVSDCPAVELVEGRCSAQPACPAFAPVPVASALGATVLVLLLATGGTLYLRRQRS